MRRSFIDGLKEMASRFWRELSPGIVVLSSVLAAVFVVGRSFASNPFFSFESADAGMLLDSTARFVLLWGLFSALLAMFCMGARKAVAHTDHGDGAAHPRIRPVRHFQLIAFTTMLLAWIPFMAPFWPGSVTTDGCRQIQVALGIIDRTNFHPYYLSRLMGFVFSLGRPCGDNCGIFLLAALFTLVSALCYARVCRIAYEWSRALGWIAVLFYAVVPLWWSYSQAIVKDTPHAALFAIFWAECAKLVYDSRKTDAPGCPAWRCAYVLVLAIGVSLTRHNGVFICVPQFLALAMLCFRKDGRLARRFLACAVVLAVAFWTLQHPCLDAMGVQPMRPQEPLSIPLQQVARFVKFHSDEVTQKERAAIGACLPYDKLASLYNPGFADPVKTKFRLSSKSAGSFFHAWGRFVCRRPILAVDSVLAGCWGYFYPVTAPLRSPYKFYMVPRRKMTPHLHFHYAFADDTRRRLSEYALAWRTIPVASLFVSPGTYTLLLFLCMGLTVHFARHVRPLLLFTGPLVLVLGCIGTPVNGEMRYALPLAACIPGIIGISLTTMRKGASSAEDFKEVKG